MIILFNIQFLLSGEAMANITFWDVCQNMKNKYIIPGSIEQQYFYWKNINDLHKKLTNSD